jgi:hypothetical protein
VKVSADVRFAVVPEWIVLADVGANAVRLYALLARHADIDGEARVYRKTLAERMRCSLDTIDRALRELVAIGALEIRERYSPKNPRQRAASDYVLHTVRGGGRTDAARGGRTDAARGGRTDAAVVNESPSERESVPSEPPSARSRKRDPIVDQLHELDGGDVRNAAIAAARIRAKAPDIDVGEIDRRARNYATHFGDATLTALALAKWWVRCDKPGPHRRSDDDLEDRIARGRAAMGLGERPS